MESGFVVVAIFIIWVVGVINDTILLLYSKFSLIFNCVVVIIEADLQCDSSLNTGTCDYSTHFFTLCILISLFLLLVLNYNISYYMYLQ